MPTDSQARATASFHATFGHAPSFIGHAPGRVELLGNHTDYNGGLVTAAAIDRGTVVVVRALEGRKAGVRAVDLAGEDVFDLERIEPVEAGHWANYIRGVVKALQDWLGPARAGFEMAIAGDVPLGAGLSSSASLQAAVAAGLLALGVVGEGRGVPAEDGALMELAQQLRQSENRFVGVGAGLLDQFSVLFGRTDHALCLDCATLAFERVPLGTPAPAIVVCDSKTSRRLADGLYNRRREECERVVAYFRALKGDGTVRTLREVSLDELSEHWERLDTVGRRRARHVLTENARVAAGNVALRSGRIEEFGRLMTASHVSSRDDFANSSPALDALIASAEEAPGFLGGKLSGAGWAGCTVNLVTADRAGDFAEAVRSGFARRQGHEPVVHICHAAAGAIGGRVKGKGLKR